MNNLENEKSMIKVEENSFFYRIKRFFRNLFNRNTKELKENIVEPMEEVSFNDNARNSFIENIKNSAENEETKLLKLQKRFHNGEVKEQYLTKEQITKLNNLYDTQIANLKKSNEIRRNRIIQYKRKLQGT